MIMLGILLNKLDKLVYGLIIRVKWNETKMT